MKYSKGQTIIFVNNGETLKTVIGWGVPTATGGEYYTEWGVVREGNIRAVK